MEGTLTIWFGFAVHNELAELQTECQTLLAPAKVEKEAEKRCVTIGANFLD
jgi:hypothetical protein